MTPWSDYQFAGQPGVTAAETNAQPPTAAADRLAAEREDRHPCGFESREYVTEVSVPDFGDGGHQRLYSPGLREPEPGS